MGEKIFGKRFAKYLIVFLISMASAFLFTAPLFFWPDQIKNVQGFFHSFESASLNLRFNFNAWFSGYYPNQKGKMRSEPKGIYQKIVIAAVDNAAIDNYGSFPFDRKVWANMLDEFNKAPLEDMPGLVFFDIVFANPSQKPDSDLALQKAFSNYKGIVGEDVMPDVIRGQSLNIQGDESYVLQIKRNIFLKECLDYNSKEVQALKKYELTMDRKNYWFKPYPKLTALLPEYAGQLKFIGTANIENEDKVYRLVPLIVKVWFRTEEDKLTNILYPSVTLSMAVKLLQSDLSNVVISPNHILVKNAIYNGKKTDFDILVDDKWQLAVNYKSPPASGFIKHISLNDINNADLPKDSIVYVGMYSKRGSHDIKYSPFGDMYGVEHNAYALGTILNRDFIQSVPKWINIIYIYLFALIIGLLVSRGTKFIGLAGFLTVALPLAIGFAFFKYNWIIITFIPITSAIVVLVSVQIFMMLTEEKDKNFIKSTFSSYLNPKLVDILIQNPERIHLGGEDKEITVFFSGVKGLDKVAETLAPKELIDYLNVYFSKMADIVMATDGTLDKYIGDAVMAFWGAPLDIEDQALKACRASVKMLEVLHEFNESQTKLGNKPIQINIGINTGNIIVGNVGSEQQKNYTAIGDSVNLASRLKGLNKFFHTSIVISEFTYEKVKDHVIARELDLTKVKGKTKPVRIYELLDVTKWD